MSEKDSQKSQASIREEEILKFWEEEKIFAKTESRPGKNGDFVFYDGPPFATGLPHFGHLLPTSLKDAVPRYQTMKGKRVLRRWGWDCHGLPVENVVEEELGLKVKKDIDKLGIDVFNETARQTVLRYVDEWKKVIPRMGRWVDMDNDYKTMNPNYTESIWWIFKNLFDRHLIYEGHKAMQLCPRCETTLSNFEVNQGYKDITDISVYVKFELASEPGTYLVAWTTTPWTLPGNVALAVNPGVEYVKVKKDGEFYILSKDLVEKVLKNDYEIIDNVKTTDLIGKKYKPPFDYYEKDESLNKEKIWQVYPADFVTTEDGTGIVHIAPAFGDDDLTLARENSLPIIQHVAPSGEIKEEVKDLAGRQAKPKGDHQSTDIEVIKLLAAKNLLLAKEKIIHSYPHCWRCDTPLLNYASSSWFVKVTDFKDKLVANNQKINWVPDYIKDGRFGKWLEGARDWAISRSRFWGAPLPVWKCESCHQVEVVGSVADLLAKMPSRGNRFIFMRHGENEANVLDIISDDPKQEHHLTDRGTGQIKDSALSLKDKNISKIVASPFLRTKESAEIVAETIGLPKEQINFDDRLGEVKTGQFTGKSRLEYIQDAGSRSDRFRQAPEGGENFYDIAKRMLEAVFDLNNQTENENILVLSHGLPLFLMESFLKGQTADDLMRIDVWHPSYFVTGQFKEIEVRDYPRNKNFELDLHRPYIDEVAWGCDCGGEFKRVLDVFDCWFESGSMPYGQNHYPFYKNESFNPEKNVGFPADFIAEGLDQTRGWFYSLLVLSTALFDKPAYKNVVVNGLILAEDGQKMSKRLKNYPPLDETINKYGADALRFYLLGSPAVHSEDFSFNEKDLAEVSRRVIGRLDNVVSFYDFYGEDLPTPEKIESNNPLDIWIVSRLAETLKEVERTMDAFETDRATRPIDDFIDDFSNWYVRRSRDRFKSEDEKDKQSAMMTTRFVLLELSKIIAPFSPFIAEDIFQKFKKGNEESVHLEDWSKDLPFDQKSIDQMRLVREVVEAGLRFRSEAGIKVRQPLSNLSTSYDIDSDYYFLIAEEVNVKSVKVDKKLEEIVTLDTKMTDELAEEGTVRELVRHIQELRKKKGLTPDEQITLVMEVGPNKDLIDRYLPIITKAVNAYEIKFDVSFGGEEIEIDDKKFILVIN